MDVSLTGIDAPKAVRSVTLASTTAKADTRFGALVAPNLVATNHSHHFNFRLDLDVDGPANSFVLGRLKTENGVPGPRKSVWVVDEQRIDRERDARLDEHSGLWKVVNPNRSNARGYPTGYLVESHDYAGPLMKKADYERAGFIAQRAVDHALRSGAALRRRRHPEPESRRARLARNTRPTTTAWSTPTSCCG